MGGAEAGSFTGHHHLSNYRFTTRYRVGRAARTFTYRGMFAARLHVRSRDRAPLPARSTSPCVATLSATTPLPSLVPSPDPSLARLRARRAALRAT
jgi:hypothetical protein